MFIRKIRVQNFLSVEGTAKDILCLRYSVARSSHTIFRPRFDHEPEDVGLGDNAYDFFALNDG